MLDITPVHVPKAAEAARVQLGRFYPYGSGIRSNLGACFMTSQNHPGPFGETG